MRLAFVIGLVLLCVQLCVAAGPRWPVALSKKLPNPHRSSSLPHNGASLKKVKSPRGGATAAASVAAVKTMTATKMKAFNLLSGGVAGTIAACITNPLEVIKTQLQSSNTVVGEMARAHGHPITVAQRIMERDGPSGFFRGLPPTLFGIIPSRSAYFYVYQQSKTALGPYLPEGSPLNAMISGVFAGICGNTLTNPIWMVRTRMQLLVDSTAGQHVYTGYGDAIKTIFNEEGIGGFYKGIFASYWGCAEGAVQFLVYEQLKTRLVKRQNIRRAAQGLEPDDHLPKAVYFFSAAAAKAVASILTYPHEVARTRLREQARSGMFKYHGMWQTLALIAKEEGPGGMYAGMGVHLMKVVPNSAIMFVTYEVVNKWLGQFTVVENGSE